MRQGWPRRLFYDVLREKIGLSINGNLRDGRFGIGDVE
jgi:hypothetical protein